MIITFVVTTMIQGTVATIRMMRFCSIARCEKKMKRIYKRYKVMRWWHHRLCHLRYCWHPHPSKSRNPQYPTAAATRIRIIRRMMIRWRGDHEWKQLPNHLPQPRRQRRPMRHHPPPALYLPRRFVHLVPWWIRIRMIPLHHHHHYRPHNHCCTIHWPLQLPRTVTILLLRLP